MNQSAPFNPISQFYRKKFGEKVQKIPVALADDCPNRRGLKGMQTCIFCDVHGSFAYPENAEVEIRQQIELHRQQVCRRSTAKKFLIYFQAYTSTFIQLSRLRRAFEVALESSDVVGIVVGTRPDCLSPAVIDLWNEYSQKTFFAVEFGVQSFNDQQLLWMRRGHTSKQSIDAIHRVSAEAPGVNLGIHLIFGWPGETHHDVVLAAQICNQLPIQNVKLHHLHVLKQTPLEKLYLDGEFKPLNLPEYAELVGTFLQHLNKEIAVHRLAALASRWDELVAPDWSRDRMRTFQFIVDHLHAKQVVQGQAVSAI